MMRRFSEIGQDSEEFMVEIISHSVLNNVWRFSEKEKNDKAIQWNIWPGASANLLLTKTKEMAVERKNSGQRVVFGLHIFQNSIARQMSHQNVVQIKEELENFLLNTQEGYHSLFWILVDRPPELKTKFERIGLINKTLNDSNRDRGWHDCYPGQVCERMRKGRLIIQNWKWREADPHFTGISGPGYHPHDNVMPSYGRYLRNYVNSHVPI